MWRVSVWRVTGALSWAVGVRGPHPAWSSSRGEERACIFGAAGASGPPGSPPLLAGLPLEGVQPGWALSSGPPCFCVLSAPPGSPSFLLSRGGGGGGGDIAGSFTACRGSRFQPEVGGGSFALNCEVCVLGFLCEAPLRPSTRAVALGGLAVGRRRTWPTSQCCPPGSWWGRCRWCSQLPVSRVA